MRILHTVSGFTAAGGGVTTCMYDLLTGLCRQGVDTRLLTMAPPAGATLYGSGENWIVGVLNDCRTPLAISRNLRRELESTDADVYHTNGLFMYANHITCKIARDKGKPYVISPHGMLYSNALQRSWWKKWPMFKLWFNKDIHHAAALHATCEQEAQEIRNFGYQGHIEIIPNPLNVPDFVTPQFIKEQKSKKSSDELVIGFLGRLHPIKGIPYLFKAMAAAKTKNMKLVIMGSGTKDYEEYLLSEAEKHRVDSQIEWVGQVGLLEKYSRLAGLDALFITSDSENFGMIVPEALVVETPVVASLGTPWQCLNEERCGWWTSRDVDNLAAIIDEIAAMPREELSAMGARGRQMALSRFSLSVIANQMTRFYQSLL